MTPSLNVASKHSLLLSLGLLTACAHAPPFERGLSAAERAALAPLRVVTVVVQDELGAQYSTRTTTAKVLNTAQISGIAFDIGGTLYIGPAPDSITPWIDTSAYVPKDVTDLPSVASALDPGNALRTVSKVALAPVLRSTERSEHAEAGHAAYKRIAPAREALNAGGAANAPRFDLRTRLHDDQARALATLSGFKIAGHETLRAWPAKILAEPEQRQAPLLLLFTQYALSPDLRQVEVRTEAMLLRPSDAADAPVYRNRFIYRSPLLPRPGKPEGEWTRGELTRILLARWLEDDAALLKAELTRASRVTAEDLARDLVGPSL
jgi:hypothetical protein